MNGSDFGTETGSNSALTGPTLFQLLLLKLHETMDLGQREATVCALYVLCSWIYDFFPMIAILRAIAPFASGKTRLIEGVMMPVMYRPFKTEGGSPTPANFRRTIMDNHQRGFLTLVIEDVGFDISPRTEPADIMINRCRQGGSASYQESDGHGGWRLVTQPICGATLLGSRLPFADVAVESRILDIDLAAQDRTTRELPDPPWEDNYLEMIITLLRDFRSQTIGSQHPKKLPKPQGVDDRVWDVSWPLAWLAEKCQHPTAMDLLEEFLRLRSEALSFDKAQEPEVMVIAALISLSERHGLLQENPSILLKEIRSHIYQDYRVDLSSHKIGRICKSTLGLEDFVSSGQSKVRGIDWGKLRHIGARFGFKDELLESQFGDSK